MKLQAETDVSHSKTIKALIRKSSYCKLDCVDLLKNMDIEVFAKATGVVVEDGLGISKTLEDREDFHRLTNN